MFFVYYWVIAFYKLFFHLNTSNMEGLTKENVLADLKEMAVSKGADADDVTMEANPTNVGLDSLDIAELVMDVEKKYNISISDSETKTIANFGDICDLVLEKTPID